MKTFYIIYLLLACQSIITGLSAQTVSGKLVDEKNEPMPYANVVLLSLPDSAFVSGTISGDDGTFSLSATAQPQIVRISSIGYTTIYRPVNPADMGIVRLTADTHQLGEVTVKADLPKMRLKGDAMVTTVAGSVLEKSGTGNDLLDKIPGISAEEGAVNVFGRGTAEVYINGRKVRSSSELEQLSSDNVKSVEVVRNPGARYDASVKAVVRILTKKAQGEGFGFDNRLAPAARMAGPSMTSSTSTTGKTVSTFPALYSAANCEAGTTNRLSLTPIWTSYGNKRWMPHTPRQNAAT